MYNLLRKLMHPDPHKRLGGGSADGSSDADELKNHAFFKDVDWEAVAHKAIPAPFKPIVKGERDTSNIDKQFLGERPVDSPVHNKLTFSQQEKVYFEQFTYNRENDEFLIVEHKDEYAFTDAIKEIQSSMERDTEEKVG